MPAPTGQPETGRTSPTGFVPDSFLTRIPLTPASASKRSALVRSAFAYKPVDAAGPITPPSRVRRRATANCMAPPRKPHKKLRSGCNTCKQRHVKCDEARPACRNCQQRQKDCSYSKLKPPPASGPAGTPSSGTASGHHSSGPSRQLLVLGQSQPQQQYTKISRAQELYLMHHYTTITFHTLANTDSPEEVYLWKMAVPQLAAKYEFLMNSLLALSSLHLAHLEPPSSSSYTEAAMQYHISGLHDFKVALEQMTEENPNALFAFSIIITIMTFAMHTVGPDSRVSTPAESLISIFKLLRGVEVITNTSEDVLRNGIFKALLQPSGGPRLGYAMEFQDGLDHAMTRLRERADYIAKYVGPERHHVYVLSIQDLETTFQHIAIHQSIARVVAWPVLVNSMLMVLFEQWDPMAQLIMIHYGVLLLHVHNRWWGKGFGVRLIRSLSDSLRTMDDEWTPFTQWARDCTEITVR
ncbi:hypothetical protein S40293_09955 [Stachybotrys chartarum IBT 40293]|nr:hypothetical protein S40293_09955 [Stachybotrys chartarum IBT 40293]